MSQNASLHIAARSDETALLLQCCCTIAGVANCTASPAAGSPTGQPMGPMLYGGRLTAVN
jgi:anti-sigma-K factor RskA